MATFHGHGESIECDSAEIIFRKIVPVKLVTLGSIKLLFKYECDRNSSVEIITELNPKVAIINMPAPPLKKGSNLEYGDKLSADGITFYYKSKTPIKIEVGGEGRTSTHTGQCATTKTFTYAVIKIPFAHVIRAINSGKEIL